MPTHKMNFWVSPLKLYLAFSLIAGPIYYIAQRIRLRQGKESLPRQRERFGVSAIPRPQGRCVLFYAASVGDSLALLDLIRALLAEADDIHVVVMTQSMTSARLLADLLPPRAVHQFAPFDTVGAVRRHLSHWRPDICVWAESELWPRLLQQTARRDIPMILINARVSDRTIARWRRWPQVARDLLKPFDRILVQEATLAHILHELAVPRVEVIGALKEDSAPLDAPKDQLIAMRAQLGGRGRWLAASTHEGEESVLVAAHERAFGRGVGAPLMVIAPRHPERGPEIMRKLQGQGWQTALRSKKEALTPNTEIYIADTLGEMGLWYRLCQVTFVGGSIVSMGGHNPYEPVKLGCAVIHGAQVSNFADIYHRLDQCGGAIMASSTGSVAQALNALQDANALQTLTQTAHAALQTTASATSAALGALCALLPPAGERRAQSHPHVNEVSILAPNFKRRLSGVTSTVVRLIPRQAERERIAAVGPNLPADVPQVSMLSLLTMSRFGPDGLRIWHARRNIEMLAGLALRNLLGKRLKLVFTSASQRHHSGYTRLLIRQMDAVVATSQKSASYLLCNPTVIPHGIDTVVFSPSADVSATRAALGLPRGGQLIGCIGRVRPSKGTDLFVTAAIDLCLRHKDLRALVLGLATPKDQNFLRGLKDRVRNAGLKERILFIDKVPFSAIADVFRALDVYVAPQRWEGFGLTPLESMACGVPVVATDVGAYSSMIIDGKTGFIVAPGSHLLIRDAVDTLLVNPDRRLEFGIAARADVAARFDIDQEARALVQLYRRLLRR